MQVRQYQFAQSKFADHASSPSTNNKLVERVHNLTSLFVNDGETWPAGLGRWKHTLGGGYWLCQVR